MHGKTVVDLLMSGLACMPHSTKSCSCFCVPAALGCPGQLDNGTQLVRLHCPWPTGLWNGPWSTGSQEWSSAAAQAQMQYFAPTLQDDATFWMTFV